MEEEVNADNGTSVCIKALPCNSDSTIEHPLSFIQDQEYLTVSKGKNAYQLVSSYEEFEESLQYHEVHSYNKYTVYKTNGPFTGKGKYPLRKPRIHWGVLSHVSPKLATTPYLIIASRYYLCHLGRCYYRSKLRGGLDDNGKDKKRYNKVTSSKKVGCPANFKVQRLIVFTENALSHDTPSHRARMGDYIRRNVSSIPISHRYLFKFPDDADHENHVLKRFSLAKEPIDKRVTDKIKELVYEGKTCVSLVTELLHEYIKTHLKVSDKSRRRFFPTRADIQRTIQKAKMTLRREKNDQDKLLSMKHSLGRREEVYFQPSINDEHAIMGVKMDVEGNIVGRRNRFVDSNIDIPLRRNGLLFFFQNNEMRKLYERYGRQGILLDPTYRFCRYSFPIYSIAVQTNVGFQTIAVFITETETKEAIMDALSLLVHWNPGIHPKYALTDYNAEDVKAVESVFKGTKAFYASFYCQHLWEQRLMRKDVSKLNPRDVIAKWKAVLNAISEEKSQRAIEDLKRESQSYLKDYFEKLWLKDIKRWAILYRPHDMLLEANEAVDRLDEQLKYASLARFKESTLSEMCAYICCHFLPEMLHQYKVFNLNFCQRSSSASEPHIPSFMHNLPQWIFDVILDRMALADEAVAHSYVEYVSDGNYLLHSKRSNAKYRLKFDIEQKLVSCSCFQFLKRRLICKHAIIVGRFFPVWNIDKISSWAFDFPIFELNLCEADFALSPSPRDDSYCVLSLQESNNHPSIERVLHETATDHLNPVESTVHVSAVDTITHVNAVETTTHVSAVDIIPHVSAVETITHVSDVDTTTHVSAVEATAHLNAVDTTPHVGPVANANNLTAVARTEALSTAELKQRCKESFRALDASLDTMQKPQLEHLYETLQGLCSQWLPPSIKKISPAENKNDIPSLFLERIHNFYLEGDAKGASSYRKRKRNKRLTFSKKGEDRRGRRPASRFSSSCVTDDEGGSPPPPSTPLVSIKTEKLSGPCEDGIVSGCDRGDRFDRKDNVVLYINNPENGSASSSCQMSLFP